MWAAQAEVLAVRDLGLSARAFWRMTPSEFLMRLEGAERRDELRWGTVGWVLAHIGTWLTRRRLAPMDLVPRTEKGRSQRPTKTAGTSRAEYEDLKKEMGA